MSDAYNSFVEKILRNFADVFAGQRPAFISRACGRVELISGHTDYNEGFIIAAAIDSCCWVAASKRNDAKICLYSEWAKDNHEFEPSADLQPVADCQWANYGRGVAAEALSRNNIAEFGRLMYASHCSARDLYQISCEQTDFLVEQICQCDGAYGARISGGGFGGSVVALARPEAAEEISQKVRKAYKDKFDIDCDIYLARPWQGTEIIELGSENGTPKAK